MSFSEQIVRVIIRPSMRRTIVNLLGLPALRNQVGALVDEGIATKQRLAAAEQEAAELRQRLEDIDSFLPEVETKGFPLPSGPLIEAVAGTERLSWFFASGKRGAQCIADVLLEHGREMESFGAILDFGCGSGRVIRHWSYLSHSRVYGTDYNPELVAWCREHLPFASFGVNQLTPPLTYADSSFDFVYALSVFTHLAEATQRAWMDEMKRVVKPGGYLLITTHGDFYTSLLDAEEQRRYQRGELILRAGNVEGSNVCGAFQSERQVRTTLAAGWEVVAFLPEGSLGTPRQDLYLLRRP